MRNPINEGVNSTETIDEAQSLTGLELGKVNFYCSNLSDPVTSEKVVRQIRAATDSPTKPFWRFLDLMKELPQASP